MSENCTHDCSSCSANCSSREQSESLVKPLHPLSTVKKVIGVVSGKGGVGKSMVTSLLATTMRRRSLHTAILDADITGPSIPKSFGVQEQAYGTEDGIIPVRTRTGIQLMSINLLLENQTDPVVWRGPIIAGTVTQFWTDVIWKDIDIMFIDMPPGTGDVPLTVFQSIPVDALVVVASPQELVGMIVEKAVRMAELMNVPIAGLVENMSYYECPDCGARHAIFGESHIDQIAHLHNIPTVCRLPIDPRLAAACDRGAIELFEGDWLEPLADALENI